MICPVCNINNAIIHPAYGVQPCKECKQLRRRNSLPHKPLEMVGDSIKQERLDYAQSTIQPRRSGELSKEYIDIHGTENIKATPEEIKNAKNVWTDVWSDNFNLGKTK